MKMTKKQAKIILIVGWSVFAAIYLAAMILLLMQEEWLYLVIMLSTAALFVTEYRRYIKRLKAKK